MRKKANEFGTAIWITSDGDHIRAENHLQNLVERYFDLNKMKMDFDTFLDRQVELYREGEGLGIEPTKELVEEQSYINSLEPLQIGELPAIAQGLSSTRAYNPETDEVLNLGWDVFLPIVKRCAVGGFDKVIDDEIQPYHFAFQHGDVRIRLFPHEFVAELSGSKLNRTTAGHIIDALFSLVGNIRVPKFRLELWDFSGSEPKSRSYDYSTMEEFFEGLGEKTRRVASRADTILKLATVFYQRVKERL